MDDTKYLLNILLDDKLVANGRLEYSRVVNQREWINDVKDLMSEIEANFDLPKTDCHISNVDDLVEEIFLDGINWGRILTTLVVTTRQIDIFLKRNEDAQAYEIGRAHV